MKIVEMKTNKNGVGYSLVDDGDGIYSVWKLCENYDRNFKGGIKKTWRYVEKKLSFDNAMNIFKRRSK